MAQTIKIKQRMDNGKMFVDFRQPQASQISTGVLIGTLGTRAKNTLMRCMIWAGVIYVIYVLVA